MDFSKDEAAPFNSGDRRYRGKLWVRLVTPSSIYHHVFWRRILVVVVALGLLVWLAVTAGVWAFVKYRRGYANVSYVDVAFYPWRREHYRTVIGRNFIASGRAEFEQKNYDGGYRLLVAGLARVPDDVPARRSVALAEGRLGHVDRALRTLTEGLKYASGDLEYLKLLFGVLLETHEDDRVIALARELLPARPDGNLVHRFTALQAATAHYHRGRIESAERLVAEWRLEDSLEGQILLARCDWDRGWPELALQRLEQQVARFPHRDELHLELVRRHRERDRPAAARRHALLRQFNDPASPGPRIDLLHTYRDSGDARAEQRELADYLHRFGPDPSALQLLLEGFAVPTVQPALVDRVHAIARENKFPLHAFNLARAQVAAAAKDYPAALALTLEALRADLTGFEYIASRLGALRVVALFGTGDVLQGQLMLTTLLEQTRLRAGDALQLARELNVLGVPAQARRVLVRAFQLDPLNQSALAELVRLEAEAGDRAALTQTLPKLLAMRKHSQSVLKEVLQRLDRPEDAPLREQIGIALARPAPASIH